MPTDVLGLKVGGMGYIFANGQKIETVIPITLSEFLSNQDLLPKSVVVERNKMAVSPSTFSEIVLEDGDRLEIVKIVAGG